MMSTDPMDLVRQCQDEVARLTANGYYAKAYQQQEAGYWSLIPGWITEDAAAHKPARCLDVGCAYGTLAIFMRMATGAEVCCVDQSQDFLSPALIEAHGLQFALANIELSSMPWVHQFDMIILTEVLEHFNFHPVPTLRKIATALAGGGRLYLSTPDASEWGRIDPYQHFREMPYPDPAVPWVDGHVHVFAEEELLEAVDAAGLTVLRLGYSPGTGRRHFNLTLGHKGGDS